MRESQPTTGDYFPGDRYIHVKPDLHVPVFLDSQKAKKIDLHKDVNAEKCFDIYSLPLRHSNEESLFQDADQLKRNRSYLLAR